MQSNDYDLMRQRRFSGKNDRYNFNNLSNNVCLSNNDIFYAQTESNWNKKRKRKLTGVANHSNNYGQLGFPQVYTSGCPHNTANLYLNKKNYSFKKKASTNNNNYFDKEQLFQKMVKLQNSLNVLNQKFNKQKIENDKQAKEIEKQNKFLNSMNENNLKKLEKMNTLEYFTTFNINKDKELEKSMSKKERDQLIKDLTRINDSEYEAKKLLQFNDDKFNLNSSINNKKKFTLQELKELYNELLYECRERNKLLFKTSSERDKIKEENDILKVANKTLISNLKRQMKKIEGENEKKDVEIRTLKKNIKCSRYTELLKENEILNKELEKLKNKLNNAYKLINDYKKQEEEIKKLYDVIKKKDFKIKAQQLEIITLSNNSDEMTKKLQDEIIIKDKLLKRQERDMKRSAFEKFALMKGQTLEEIDNKLSNFPEKKYLTLQMSINDINKNNPELYQFYIEMKHKGINSSKNFEFEVLNKISDVCNVKEAKTIYIDLAIDYFSITKSDTKSRDIIFNLADKEFVNNRSIHEIKTRQLKIFDTLFNKNAQLKSYNQLKKYIDSNNLEELINNTFKELDKSKLGFVTFEEMKHAISDVGLNDFLEEILTLTKSEIFNRVDYYNLLVLFNDKKSPVDVNNYISSNNEQKLFNINDDNNENVVNNDNNDNINNLGGIHDINTDNDNNNNNQENNIIASNSAMSQLEKKLKIFSKKVKKGASVDITNLKEINNSGVNVINIAKLKEFLMVKDIELKDNEINALKKEYGLNGEFIQYDKLVDKLIENIHNESEHDEN